MLRSFLQLWFVAEFLSFRGISSAKITRINTASFEHLVAHVILNSTSENTTVSTNGWILNGLPVTNAHIEYERASAGEATRKHEYSTWPMWDIDYIIKLKYYFRVSGGLHEGEGYILEHASYGNKSIVFQENETRCESLKTNQVSYFPSGRQEAVFGIWLGTGGAFYYEYALNYSVVDVTSGRVVYTNVWDEDLNATFDPTSAFHTGEYTALLPMTLPSGGPYRIVLHGHGCSDDFYVGQMRAVAFHTMRGLYHQRCGISLDEEYTNSSRCSCHNQVRVTDAEPPGHIQESSCPIGCSNYRQVKNISGGYHDAGDFDRRQSHTLIPMGLLALYGAFPENFSDNVYNIPESGNGIPDLLDEALWGVRLYEHLQEHDGGIRAGTEATRHPEYGAVNAATDDLEYRTYRRDFHNTACGAGMFAQASRLVRQFRPALADALLERAERAWGWLDVYEGEDARAAQTMYAALELYETTGNTTYHEAFVEAALTVFAIGRPVLRWPQEYRPWHMNIPNLVGGMYNTPYFFTALISTRTVNATVRNVMETRLVSMASGVVASVAGEVYPHGPVPTIAWGSLTSQGRVAEPVLFAYRLTEDASLLACVGRLADYALGLNPLGRSFITGLGHMPPTNPLHLDSYYTEARGLGSVPGITIYGPDSDPSGRAPGVYTWTAHFPGYDSLAPQRRFVDGWTLVEANEFTTWETMAPNAVMHGFLDIFQLEFDDVPRTTASTTHASLMTASSNTDSTSNSPVTTMTTGSPLRDNGDLDRAESSKNSAKDGVIIGVSVASCIVVAILVIILLLTRRRRRHNKRNQVRDAYGVIFWIKNSVCGIQSCFDLRMFAKNDFFCYWWLLKVFFPRCAFPKRKSSNENFVEISHPRKVSFIEDPLWDCCTHKYSSL
eukprot:m.487939 g.487939  ORF g.487939 m.487939 type:complete len:894 (-) comp21759_c0_seq4:409-3090(-)